MTTDAGLLFLEGRPPIAGGADPCCFRGRRPEGIALDPPPKAEAEDDGGGE